MKILILSADLDFVPVRAVNERRIISVFLLEGNGKHNFRCSECGKIVFQYTGDIEAIFDGAVMPEEEAVIDTLCHRCKIIYRVFVIKSKYAKS